MTGSGNIYQQQAFSKTNHNKQIWQTHQHAAIRRHNKLCMQPKDRVSIAMAGDQRSASSQPQKQSNASKTLSENADRQTDKKTAGRTD